MQNLFHKKSTHLEHSYLKFTLVDSHCWWICALKIVVINGFWKLNWELNSLSFLLLIWNLSLAVARFYLFKSECLFFPTKLVNFETVILQNESQKINGFHYLRHSFKQCKVSIWFLSRFSLMIIDHKVTSFYCLLRHFLSWACSE